MFLSETGLEFGYNDPHMLYMFYLLYMLYLISLYTHRKYHNVSKEETKCHHYSVSHGRCGASRF